MQLHFPEGIDSTMLSTFDSCPQKFLYEFVLRKVPTGRSVHLHAGGALAAALDAYRKEFYGPPLQYLCFADRKPLALRAAWIAFVHHWGDYEAPEKQYKDFINMWGAVVAYFEEYPPDLDYFQPYMKSDGMPATEFRFAIPMAINHPITGDPILFTGRADQLSRPMNGDNVCYVQDEKTTKAMGSSWYYQWDMRGQFYGYAFAARSMGFPCIGALVRGIAIQQTQYQFAEKPLLFTDEQLARWWREAHKKVQRMVSMYEQATGMNLCAFGNRKGMDLIDQPERQLPDAHDAFPMSFGDACASYGGCQFKDACLRTDPWALYHDWETRIWNPLALDPTAESEDRTKDMETQSLQEMMG